MLTVQPAYRDACPECGSTLRDLPPTLINNNGVHYRVYPYWCNCCHSITVIVRPKIRSLDCATEKMKQKRYVAPRELEYEAIEVSRVYE